MAGPGCRLLRLAGVTLAVTANCAAVTAAAQSVTTLTPNRITDLTSSGLNFDLLLSVSLMSVVLLLGLIVTSVGLCVALNRRATHGTYSPSRQEKEGSRVEMWSITQPPPMERLI